MQTKNGIFGLIFLFLLGWPVQVTQPDQLEITAPLTGEALQGVVTISGTTEIPGFRSAEITFAYQDDQTSTWFLVEQSSAPVKENIIAAWDTSTITDGEYRLRVQIFLNDGQVVESFVDNLRVRNYTQIETSTPDPRAQERALPTSTQTPHPDYQASANTPTLLPTNPAELTHQDLQMGAVQGVTVVIGVLFAAVLYWGLRLLIRRL